MHVYKRFASKTKNIVSYFHSGRTGTLYVRDNNFYIILIGMHFAESSFISLYQHISLGFMPNNEREGVHCMYMNTSLSIKIRHFITYFHV